MASGDVVVSIIEDMPPATTYATFDVRAGGSTPAESLSVYDFDAGTDEYMDFKAFLKGYDSGGLTIRLGWAATSATSGVTRWGVAIRRFADDAEDINASQTYDFNESDCTAASASGEIVYDNITFTDGADMDSWADGEFAIIRVFRNADHANDTMTGDAELVTIVGYET